MSFNLVKAINWKKVQISSHNKIVWKSTLEKNGPEILQDFFFQLYLYMGFPGGSVVKNPPANAGDARAWGFNPWVGKILWRRKWQPSPVFLPGKSHGQRSLEGYCPQGHKSQTWLSD